MNMNTRYMFKLPDEAKPSDTKELICLTEKGVDSVIIRKTWRSNLYQQTKSSIGKTLNSIPVPSPKKRSTVQLRMGLETEEHPQTPKGCG